MSMTGGSLRNNVVRFPIGTAQVFNADDAEVCKAVMVWTECYQVGKLVRSTFGYRYDVVNVGCKIKATDNAALIVAYACLVHVILTGATVPPGIVHATNDSAVMLAMAKTIAVVIAVYLTWVQSQFGAAVVAWHTPLILPSCRRYQPLPFTRAHIVATRHTLGDDRRTLVKGLAAYAARLWDVAAAIVPIVRALVLMPVDKSRLRLAWKAAAAHFTTTAAGAKDRLSVSHLSLSNHLCKRIILANTSYGNY